MLAQPIAITLGAWKNARKGNSGNMKLIKTLLAGLAAMVVAAGFALSAQATPITGILNIAGTANFNTTR